MTTRDNSGRTQIPPEIFEQFMKQQEQKAMQSVQPAPQQTMTTVNVSAYSVPTDFVDLPSQGRFYSESHPWYNKKTIEVRFMTTKEEDIITSPSYAFFLQFKIIATLSPGNRVLADTRSTLTLSISLSKINPL